MFARKKGIRKHMAIGKKTGGRRKGTPNRATAERQAAIAATGKTPLEIMVENARFADAEGQKLLGRLLDMLAPDRVDIALGIAREMFQWREAAVRWARSAAPYIHPQLAAVAHKHLNADGTAIRPVVNVIIQGKPEPRPLPVATPGISDQRH
jgi:hypothetical protein